MKRPKVVLLLAGTARSSAYAQALGVAGIVPDGVILYGGSQVKSVSTRELNPEPFPGIFFPDVLVDIKDVVQKFGWSFVTRSSKELDDGMLLSALDKLAPDILVYSGYGGQIVPPCILTRTKVLHVHSGWLPEYRGSTTLYHEIIEHQQCAASALYLDERIDTGPVLKRKRYPMPPAGGDVDYLYDNAIRADLLVQTLIELLQHGDLAPISPQNEEYPAYFIIHPLLKHLALFAIDVQGDINE